MHHSGLGWKDLETLFLRNEPRTIIEDSFLDYLQVAPQHTYYNGAGPKETF